MNASDFTTSAGAAARLEALRHDLKAALVDMDGTLYDSMPHHADAWRVMTSEIGLDINRDEFFLYEGMTGAATIDLLFRRAYGHGVTAEEAARLYKRKTEIFAKMPPVSPMPGAQRLMAEISRSGVECVLVTGSGQNTLLNRLDTDYPGIFAKRVTSRDVSRGKPYPDPYLMALCLAGCNAQEAIAFENAPLGVRSAVAAGVFTVAVMTGPIAHSEFVDAGADMIFTSMPDCRDFFCSWLTQR